MVSAPTLILDLHPYRPNPKPKALIPKLSEGSLPSSDRPQMLAEGPQPERMAERASRGPHFLTSAVNSEGALTLRGIFFGGPAILDLPYCVAMYNTLPRPSGPPKASCSSSQGMTYNSASGSRISRAAYWRRGAWVIEYKHRMTRACSNSFCAPTQDSQGLGPPASQAFRAFCCTLASILAAHVSLFNVFRALASQCFSLDRDFFVRAGLFATASRGPFATACLIKALFLSS